MLLPQMSNQFARVHGFGGEKGESARLLRIIGSKYADSFHEFQTPRPAFFQVAKPRSLALDTYALVKRKRLGNRVVIRRRMGADLFKLANIGVLFLVLGHEWPELSDFGLSHVQEARTVRRQEPFVQTGSVVITVQVRVFEGKVSK